LPDEQFNQSNQGGYEMSKALTAKMVYDLDRMNVSSQRAGGIGTILSGGITPPAVGALAAGSIMKYTVAPTVKSATATMLATALTAAPQVGFTTGLVQPDVPRNITIKGNAAGNAGNVVIHGTDINGTVVSDTIALNAAVEVVGLVAFKTITSVDLPAETHAGTDTVSLGRGVKIGLPVALADAALLLAHEFNGANDAGTFVPSATINLCVFPVAGTMDGIIKVDLWFYN
jgi:hypothetical protein